MDRLHYLDCLECGQAFESKRSDAKFCSVAHRVAYNRRHVVEHQAVTVNPPVLAPAPAVTPSAPCRCPDCRARAVAPTGFWDDLVRRALDEAEARDRARPPEGLDEGARCDYCGRIFELAKSKEYWEYSHDTEDGTVIYRTGVYCSKDCGERMTTAAGSVRG
jgi:hypothetical protein